MLLKPRTIDQITADFSISMETLARFLNTTSRMVMRWKKEGVKPSSHHRERFEKIAYIDRRLRQILKPDAIERWLHAYNDCLGGETSS